jgi:hypothetical protein
MATKFLKNAIQCVNCTEVIESKHTHDFVSCKCGSVSVDGGLEYRRLIGNPAMIIDRAEREVDGKLVKENKPLMSIEQRNEKVNGEFNILETLIAAKVCLTHAEAKRLIYSGVVKQNGYTYQNIEDMTEPLPLHPIKVGKRTIHSLGEVVKKDEEPPYRIQYYVIDSDAIQFLENVDADYLDYNSTEDLENVIDCLAEYEYKTEEERQAFIAGLQAIGTSHYCLITKEEVEAIKKEIDNREAAE